MSMTHLDSADFLEIVIKHIIRDKASYSKAKDLKIKVDDFGDSVTGIKAYREFVAIALEVNNSPIAYDIFVNAVAGKIADNKFAGVEADKIAEFIEQIYNTELSSEYVVNNLPDFIKRKRGQRLQITHKDDLDTLAREYSKLADDITISDANEHIQVINPFESSHKRSNVDFIPTGLTRVDAIIQGIGIQEMGLIMAASGGGKTAVATVFSKNAAVIGKKVLYLSLEEPAVNITQRFYANVFNTSYTNLYRAAVADDYIDNQLNNLDCDLRHALMDNLRIVDLRDLVPCSPSVLHEWLIKYCTENDFWPDLIMLDQLEFLNSDEKTASQWEMYGAILLSIFKISSGLLAGRKAVAWYILHQLTDMMLNYTSKQIAGFKGAMRKCSLVIVLGRKDQYTPELNIHSLKARNSPNFKLPHRVNFETMSIQDDAPPRDPNQRTLGLNNNPDVPVVSAHSLVRIPIIPVEGSALPPNPIL